MSSYATKDYILTVETQEGNGFRLPESRAVLECFNFKVEVRDLNFGVAIYKAIAMYKAWRELK